MVAILIAFTITIFNAYWFTLYHNKLYLSNLKWITIATHRVLLIEQKNLKDSLHWLIIGKLNHKLKLKLKVHVSILSWRKIRLSWRSRRTKDIRAYKHPFGNWFYTFPVSVEKWKCNYYYLLNVKYYQWF